MSDMLYRVRPADTTYRPSLTRILVCFALYASVELLLKWAVTTMEAR